MSIITLNGDYGEGGGQIVRTALALAAVTGKPFEINNIRKGRSPPGLKAQHIHCIKILQQLCSADVEGTEQGSEYLRFIPGKIEAKEISFDVGTAGSIPLILQSIVLPICLAGKKTKVSLKGGTDVKWSMSVDYFRKVILPHYIKLADIEVKLLGRGYYPAGGGNVEITARPKIKKKEFSNPEELINILRNFGEINITTHGKLIKIDGVSHASLSLENSKVAERQATAAGTQLKKLGCPVNIRSEYSNSASTGSGITLWASFSSDKEGKEIDTIIPVVIGSDILGEKEISSEKIGENAASKLIEEINSGAPVDKHLADNMIPLLGIFGGRIKTSEITEHCKTNIYTTENFLDTKFRIEGNEIIAELNNDDVKNKGDNKQY